jgi:hypothetical protein
METSSWHAGDLLKLQEVRKQISLLELPKRTSLANTVA